MSSPTNIVPKFGWIHGTHITFKPIIILGYHIQNHKIEPTIIVNIANICSHAEVGSMLYVFVYFVGEASISVVDIKEIRAQIVVCHINVLPTVIIKIRYTGT